MRSSERAEFIGGGWMPLRRVLTHNNTLDQTAGSHSLRGRST